MKILQTFRELARVTPSILFLPRLDSWWEVTSETFQMTLLSSLTSLLPSTPLLVLATAECLWEELPPKLKEVFPDTGSQAFNVVPPTLDQRKLFFYEVLLEKPFLPPPSKPKLLSGVKSCFLRKTFLKVSFLPSSSLFPSPPSPSLSPLLVTPSPLPSQTFQWRSCQWRPPPGPGS